jgi:hypothetical protein
VAHPALPSPNSTDAFSFKRLAARGVCGASLAACKNQEWTDVLVPERTKILVRRAHSRRIAGTHGNPQIHLVPRAEKVSAKLATASASTKRS